MIDDALGDDAKAALIASVASGPEIGSRRRRRAYPHM
jgi:hypothetical protein